jgi:hypothetical protein
LASSVAEDLTEPARMNITVYKSPNQQCRNREAVCQDATAFRFPPEPTVLFMANPFSGSVMERFIANVEDSLRRHPRPFFVIYRQAQEAALWDASPYFQKVVSHAMFQTYRTRAAAHNAI